MQFAPTASHITKNAAINRVQVRKRKQERHGADGKRSHTYVLRFAVSKEPDNPLFQYHLGMIYKETNQIGDAQTALKRALNSHQDFIEKSLARQALKEIASRN